MLRRALLGSVAGLLAAPALAQQVCFDRMDCFDSGLSGGPSFDAQFLTGVAPPGMTYTGSGGSFFNAAGTAVAATTNVPRFDNDPASHAPLGLLIEEARTNLLLNTATPLTTQSVTTAAATYVLSFFSSGTIVLSGTASGTLVGAGLFPARTSLVFTATAGTLTATVTGVVRNAQIEAGGFVTSWIPSAGSAGVRTADVATIPVASNPLAGSWAAELIAETLAPANAAILGGVASTIRPLFLTTTYGTGIFDTTATLTTGNNGSINTVMKTASAWTGGTASVALNAGAVASGAMANGFASVTTLRLMGDSTVGDTLSGWLRRVRYWPRALAPSELQAAST